MSEVESTDVVIGHITLTSVMSVDGGNSVKTHTEGLNIFQVIGMLTAELDVQRKALLSSYEPDED